MPAPAMRIVLLLLSLSLSLFGAGQEIPFSAFPPQMRAPIPDAVLYRLFLEQAAAFETEARTSEAHGKSGEAFRHHLIHQFDIPEDALPAVAQAALEFTSRINELRSQQKSLALRFHDERLADPGRLALDSPPSLPPELAKADNQITSLSLQMRDQIRLLLGTLQFTGFDAKLHRRDVFYRGFPNTLKPPSEATVDPMLYADSSIDIDSATGQVTAYARSEMDGVLLPYYEPTLNVTIRAPNGQPRNPASCPASTGATFTCQFTAVTYGYGIYTEHIMNLTVHDPGTQRWFDGAGFEYTASLDIAVPFEVPLAGAGPAQFIPDRSFILANTYIWTDWPHSRHDNE